MIGALLSKNWSVDMAFCLTTDIVKKFRRALKDGEIDPLKLAGMTSLERNAFLAKYVGENAKAVNALFESKLLLKNQKAGYISWAKKVVGMSPQAKTDMISRIERMQEILDPKESEKFLADLASTRLRLDVTQEEAKNIADFSKKVTDLKAKANEDGTFTNPADKATYGLTKVAMEKYIGNLKLATKRIFFKEQPVKKVLSIISELPGTLKSAVASMDNSFWGRQGIKTFWDPRLTPTWMRNFLKSWVDIGKQITAKGKWYTSGDDGVMDMIKADIYSRPNAVNGKYAAGKYGLSVLSEEAYPSSFPEKIPLLGRLFKASEVAYNGGALRLRADLADRLIKIAEQQGVDTLDPEQAQGMGQLISSMTGRGGLGKAEMMAKEINTLFFSIKFLKSNFDTLTAHRFDQKVMASPVAKKEAAKNLMSIIATLGFVLTIAKQLNKDSVEEDPRSTNFGRIKVFGHWVDMTGGMAGLITLASRLVPTVHKGEWGLWTKSSTGNWTNLTSGKYGQQTGMDVFESFVEGKLSPVVGLLRDAWKGKNFQGQPVTLKNSLQNIITPISIQNFNQLKEDPNSSNLLGSMILDALGFSTSTYTYKSDWSTNTSKEMLQFKKQVGDKFNQANDDYNKTYNAWYTGVSQSEEFKKLSDDGKSSLITAAREKIKAQIFKDYHFMYKPEVKTQEKKQEEAVIKKLKPQ